MSWKKKFVRNWGQLGMKFNWTTKKLSEIAYINPRESIGKGVVAKKVSMDRLQPFCRDIPEFVLEEYKGGTKFKNDDTIMARITPCLENGKIAKVSILSNDEIGFGSTEYIVFRAIDGVSDADFLYYLICSPLVRNPAIKSMVGSSGRQRVQTDVVADLDIELPPIEEQRKIGGLLKTIDDKIKLNKEINNNLEQQAQAVYYKMFSEVNTVPVELSSIIDVRDGTHDSPKAQATGYYLITSKHLLPFGVDKASANHISKADFDKINERSLVETQDILMSMIGTIGLISYIPYETVDFAIKNVALFKTSRTPELAYYFLCYLKSEKTLQHIGKCLAGSTQKYISLSELRKMPIYSPTTNEIREFNCLVKPMFEKIVSRTYENALLVEMRDSLLPKLVSGELDVSDIDF